MTIVWKASYEIDNGIVDADHKAIIAGINEIRGLLDQEITSAKLIETIRELRALAVAHFGREEQLQELLFFANQETHHLEHVQLIAELDQVIDGLSTIADTLPSAARFRLKGFFHRWILGHILTSDLEMQPYLSATRSPTESLDDVDSK